MKKKSIFVVALAALMLIAFTACEQPANIWNPNGKVPTALNITQNEPFVEGQLFDASKFSVEVVYQDGSKETTTSANVTLQTTAGAQASSVLAPGAVVSASLTTVGANAGSFLVSSTRAIDVRTIDSVTVVAPATLDLNSSVDSIAVKSLFTVTANYEGGSVVVKPAEFAISGLNTTTEGEDKTGAIDVKFASNTAVATSDAFTIDIVDPDDKPKEEVNKWTGKIGYAVTPASNSVVYVQRGLFDADAMVTLYKQIDRYGDGSELYYEELVPGTNEKLTITLAADLKDAPENEIRFEEKPTATVNFSYEYVDNEGTRKLATITQSDTSEIVGSITFEDSEDGEIAEAKTTITISNIISDYPTAISATWKGKGGVANTAYEVSNNITPATDFDVNITWKSEYDVDLTGVSFTVNPSTAPSLETANNNYPVTLTYGTKGYVDQVTTATSYVAIAADPDWEDPNA